MLRSPQRGGSPALLAGDARVSYRELSARADRLARRLRRLGVGPESRVALCAGRSVEMVAGVLAVLRAGGAYVPLDPSYPRERLAFMFEESRPVVLLAQQHDEEAGHQTVLWVQADYLEGSADSVSGGVGSPRYRAVGLPEANHHGGVV